MENSPCRKIHMDFFLFWSWTRQFSFTRDTSCMLRHLVIINSPQQNYWGSSNLGTHGMMWLAGQLGLDCVLSFLLKTWCNYSSCLWPVSCWWLDEVIRILPLAVKSINLAVHCTWLRHKKFNTCPPSESSLVNEGEIEVLRWAGFLSIFFLWNF